MRWDQPLLVIRPLRSSDVSEILMVQRSAYSDGLIESPASFATKLGAWPQGAWGAFEDDGMSAYLFCHPWTSGEAAPLNSKEMDRSKLGTCLYIHDLAVRADRRGRGLGDRLVSEALSIAERNGFRTCALVAVQSSRAFWERHGFRAWRELEYGNGMPAHYMVRDAAPSMPTGREHGNERKPPGDGRGQSGRHR
jgi:GNAT superfamily N-acetyltransferase